MFPSTFNLGHALPLVFTRFSCCALRRAQLRVCAASRDADAATGGLLVAIRNYEPSRQLRHSHFAAKCCVNAAGGAALVDSTVLIHV